jgi:hypothetical protein
MNASSAPAPRHQSNLPTGRERFLADVVQFAFTDGWRSPDDFLRHFGPRTLINGLANDEPLKVRVLTSTTRVNERLAARKTNASAAEDLALALDSGLTNAEQLLALIPPDDRVRNLDASKLWAFLTEIEFWKGQADDPRERERYVQRVTFILESALHEGVLRLQDIADGIGFKRIANSLPRAELQRVVEHALSRAREGQRLTEEQLLEAVPLRSLMAHIPLEHTWSEVVLARLARPLQFVAALPEEAPRSRRMPPPPPSRKGTSRPPRTGSSFPESLLELQRGLEQSAPPGPSEQLEELIALTAEDSEATINFEIDTRLDVKAHRDEPRGVDDEPNERVRVTEALARLGRLPPQEPELTLPILLSIESMYAELSHAIDDDQRYTIVRDAFPNQTHLRVALIALIRLLDEGRRTTDAVLLEADGDALIRTLLFEERRLNEATSTLANGDAGHLFRSPIGQLS